MTFTKTTPQTLGLEPSFGYGDRLGLATPGHLMAQLGRGGPIQPIFAQQSIREMKRTGRSAADVMQDAVDGLFAGEFGGRWGADADHLKTHDDVQVTAEAGFVFFTIDPSDEVDQRADLYPPDVLESKFEQIRSQITWIDQYLDTTVAVENGPTIHFDEASVKRAAVKYGRALIRALDMAASIAAAAEQRGQDHEIELSVDETPQPTSLAEHYIIADQLGQAKVKLVSLAPRYIGDFEKGIDFKGDLAAFEQSLAQHAAIARQLGPYKLSLHSGSDKLSIYEIFARVTRGLFHVKTAGTSYLEALRVVVRKDPSLMERIIDFSRRCFDRDKATYHISATLGAVPAPTQIADPKQIERIYLDQNDGRQILHVTYGSVLTDPTLGPMVPDILQAYPQTHCQVLEDHFGNHLDALVRGLGKIGT